MKVLTSLVTLCVWQSVGSNNVAAITAIVNAVDSSTLLQLRGGKTSTPKRRLADVQRHRHRHLQGGSSAQLSGIDLINAATEQRITTLTNGQVVAVSAIPGLSGPNFNINATFVAPSSISYVVFGYNGNLRTDGVAPYSFCGNSGPLFNTCSSLGLGTHTVTATPYSSTSSGGTTAGTTVTVTFTIVQTAAAPAPAPAPAPTPAPALSPVTAAPATTVTKSPVVVTKSPVVVTATASPLTKAPVPAPVPAAPTPTVGIVALQLMYTGSPAPHQALLNLTLGNNTINVIDLAHFNVPTAAFSIQALQSTATTTPLVQSVQFSTGRSDSAAPFSLCGNSGLNFGTCSSSILGLGVTTTTAVVPYPQSSLQGTPFPTVSATLRIIDSRTAAPVTKAPTKAPVASVPTPPTSPVACTVPKLGGSSWQAGTKYPINIGEAQGAFIGTTLVIVSGFKNSWKATTTETYSLDTSNAAATWQRLDDQPSPPGVTHAGYVVVNNKLYLCSGYVGASNGPSTNQCLVLDIFKPRGQQWSSIAPLPGIGQAGGGLVYDSTLNAVFYAGGAARAVGSSATMDSEKTWMYSFNNVTAGWQPRAPIPFQANHMSFVTTKDGNGVERHFFVGGQKAEDEGYGNVMSHYEYNAISNTWTQRQSLPFPRGHSSSSTRAVGCGYVMIGGTTNGWDRITDVTYYSIATNTWTKIGDLPGSGINTPVCDINRVTNMLYCESGGATYSFSHKRQLLL